LISRLNAAGCLSSIPSGGDPGTGGKGPPIRTRNNETGSRKAPPHPIVASVGTLQMR